MTDDPEWITKADAAALLGVDARTIERRARAGKLNAKARPGFPTRYWAADVEKLRQTTAQEVRTGLLETVHATPSNGNGAVAHHRARTATMEEVLVDLLQAARRALTQGATGPTDGPTGATGPTLSAEERAAQYVTVDQAAMMKGLTARDLRRAIRQGELPARHRERKAWRSWRIRRKDLEQL